MNNKLNVLWTTDNKDNDTQVQTEVLEMLQNGCYR